MRNRSFRRGGVRLVMAAGLLAVSFGVSSCTPEKPPEPAKVDPNVGFDFGTVHYQALIAEHPQYESLKQIDDEIARLEQDKGRLRSSAMQELQKQGSSKMNAAVTAAKAKLEGEREAVEAEMANLSASLSAQVQGEMRGLQSQLESQLKADIAKIPGAAPPPEPAAPPPKLSANTEAQIQDYMANLGMVRERNLAARRLELEKRVGDEVNAKKSEVDGQIAAYESDLSAQYQSERLNLQLTAQNSADEAAKTAAEARLGAISQEVDAKKNERRKELEAGYLAIRSEKSAQLQGDLEVYQRELDAEVAENVRAKRKQLNLAVAEAPRPQQRPQPQQSAEIQAKIAEMNARMQSEIAAKKATLSAQMQGKATEARARLQAKQTEVEANLKVIEAQIAKEINESIDKLAPETKKKIDANEKKVKELQAQRKTLFESIAADINRKVGEVAKKKDVEMVVGVFQWSSYPDLDDQATVAVKQMESSK